MSIIRKAFRRLHYPIDVIALCVRWYLSYSLSLRNIEEMMAERGITLDHSTLHRWVVRLIPLMNKTFRKYKRQTSKHWRMDETYIKVKGKWQYLYRAVDKYGKTIDFLLTARRYTAAALRFFKKAISQHGVPDGIRIHQALVRSYYDTNIQTISRTALIYLYVKTLFHTWYQELNSSPNIKNITFYHLNSYKDYIIDNKRKKVSSINRNIQSLKNFFQFLVKQKVLKISPADKIRFLRKSKITQPQALNKQEIHKLLSITSNSSHGTQKRNYEIIQIILQTGIRVSELIGLEFRDLEIYERSGQVRIVNAKGGKERTVPLNNTARRALSNYFGKRELEGKGF